MQNTKKLITCSRGHQFYKSSDCKVCPKCWPGYYKEKGGVFTELSAPAQRALLNAGISTILKLSKHTKKEVLALHGMGPASIPLLESALKDKGLTFKK